jgi:hypothetical protein
MPLGPSTLCPLYMIVPGIRVGRSDGRRTVTACDEDPSADSIDFSPVSLLA